MGWQFLLYNITLLIRTELDSWDLTSKRTLQTYKLAIAWLEKQKIIESRRKLEDFEIKV
jgi:hypothetical protein